MNPYEELVEKARKEGLIVKEFPLKSSDGRIKGYSDYTESRCSCRRVRTSSYYCWKYYRSERYQ